MKKCISIDWLQIYCDCSHMAIDPSYEWKKQTYQTKQFRLCHEIIYRNEKIATAVSVPTSPIISKDAMIIKVTNRELYGQDMFGLVEALLNKNGLIYRGITRIDLAVDFNLFFNSLHPEQLIRDFLKDKYLKNGRGKFTVSGEQKLLNSYQYLRFGKNTSEVAAYMYNKTVELQQVVDKPYIRHLWELSGLDINKDIWRLEISIKGNGRAYIDEETGEWKKFEFLDLKNKDFLNQILFSYIDKYFSFRINDGTINKSRMQPLQLFDNKRTLLRPLYLPNITGSNRSDKIFLKKLYSLDQELRGYNDSMLSAQKELITTFVTATGLINYMHKNENRWGRDYPRPD